MSKQVKDESKVKVYTPKKKEGDFSLYSNLNPNADKNTQVFSRKKLIKGILHSVGFGGHKTGDPIELLDTNINHLVARMKKEKVDQEIITSVKLQAQK